MFKNEFFKRLRIKIALFFPLIFIVVFVISFQTIWNIYFSLNKNIDLLKNNVKATISLIEILLQNEYSKILQRVEQNLSIVENSFKGRSFFIDTNKYKQIVINQYTKKLDTVFINKWYLNNKLLNDDTSFVDSLQKILGGTITIFQRFEKGFVRITTNVRAINNQRSIYTYIPDTSVVVKNVLEKGKYLGRAFVVDQYYLTNYKALYCKDSIVGMIYFGEKEKDITKLTNFLRKYHIGENGIVYLYNEKEIVDNDSNVSIIHNYLKTRYKFDNKIKKDIEFVTHFEGEEFFFYSKYFDLYDLNIAAILPIDKELFFVKKDIIYGTLLISGITLILLIFLIIYYTDKRIYDILKNIEKLKKQTKIIEEALMHSEDRFKILFDSVGDDIFVTDENENIIEVNKAACETLGYTREELLSKKISDIKSQRYYNKVHENRKIIYEKGHHTFESEHVTKSGKIIQVEFSSKVVIYNNQKLILSIVRNVSKQREFERKILSAVIQGEEKERQRFAREMHDGLGPLLSTIKIYTNELYTPNISNEEREEMLKQINELIDEAILSIRTISNNLVPSTIYKYGFINTLKSFCEKINKTGQLNIKFETQTALERFQQNVELILYRITTELINNTLKHAQANNVLILFVQQDNFLSLYFKDDGKGFDVDYILSNENVGMGLKNIISRVKSINGKYDIISSPNNGFTMKIELSI